MMGVRWEDAGQVAELIALKTFLNEFVAYEKLSELINNRVTCATEGHILSVSALHFFCHGHCVTVFNVQFSSVLCFLHVCKYLGLTREFF